MNFLCHALPYLDRPVLAACTGIPDFLSVIDRKIRARGRMASPFLDSNDTVIRDVARGITAHIDDDRWFHGGETFVRMNLEFAVALRDLMPGDAGFRPTFLGHILIEMLLDANYLLHDRSLVDRYYAMFESLPLDAIESSVNMITGKPTDKIALTMKRFAETRFLYDYAADDSLLFRLNQVMRRVGLAQLDDAVQDWLPWARAQVLANHERLLNESYSMVKSGPLS
jgi:hypothetical protein